MSVCNGSHVNILCNLLCTFQVSKLAALGYNPILFIGKKKQGASSVTAEVITHMCPGGDGPAKPFLEKMSRAYEYLVKSKANICYYYLIYALGCAVIVTDMLTYFISDSQTSQSPEDSSHTTPLPTTSQPFSSPHSPDPSTFLPPSVSHPQIDSEEETYTLTLIPVEAPSSSQENMNESKY